MAEVTTYGCENCDSENSYCLVQYGSYFLTCYDCKQAGPATSFIEVMPHLSGDFEVIEVDTALNELGLVMKGEITEYVEKIRREANKGKIIWLKRPSSPA